MTVTARATNLHVPIEAVIAGVDAYHAYRRQENRPAQIISDGEATAIIRAAMYHISLPMTPEEVAWVRAQRDRPRIYPLGGRIAPDDELGQAMIAAWNKGVTRRGGEGDAAAAEVTP